MASTRTANVLGALALAASCTPHEISLFDDRASGGSSAGGGNPSASSGGSASEGTSTGASENGGTDAGGSGGSSGGSAGTGSGAAGSGATGAGPAVGGGTSGGTGGTGLAGAPSAPEPVLVDDFEDQDTRAIPPAGWWYLVNDGTGYQQLAIARDGADSAYLRTAGEDFSDWGAGIGVDVLDLSIPAAATHLRFEGRASEPLEVEVQIVDSDDARFTRRISFSADWQTFALPIDSFVGEQALEIHPNPEEADELHWFVLAQATFDFAIDDVVFTAE